MIVVISSKRDGHIQSVATAIESSGATWVRVNTEDLATNLSLVLDPTSGSGTVYIRDSERRFALSEVRAVWYRKPDPVNLSHFALGSDASAYIEAEFNETLQGLYSLLRHVFWINDPLSSRLAHRKLAQLQVAATLGLRTPRTLVTNEPNAALEFASSLGWDLAIKSLSSLSVAEHAEEGIRQYGMFTRRINQTELLAQKHRISNLPTIFQEYIEKSFEIRATVVGSRAFICKIHSQERTESSEDVRFNIQALRHEIIEWPELEEKLVAYLQAFRLEFGCFDIAVTPHGDPVFFECNPNGQWLWIQELTGAPIGAAIAELLLAARLRGQT